MVIEEKQLPFTERIFGAGGALSNWLWIIGSLLVVSQALVILGLIIRLGPRQGFNTYIRSLGSVFDDLFHTSPRRVYALTKLSVLESVRRMVMAAFVVFLIVLLFAGWFLDKGSHNPAELFLSFVLTATLYMVIALALFLSVFSLPNDINKKTIHTVVTKPTRSTEIVLGRILGFTVIGTAMLAMTGLLSYVFVVRVLSHSHEVDASSLATVERPDRVVEIENPLVQRGQTTIDNGHRHEIFLREDGSGYTDLSQGHWHEITSEEIDGRRVHRVGPPQEMLVARVPIYGDLTFRDRTGEAKTKGINVGNEWTYLSYWEGGTLGAGVWDFDGVTPELFPQELPIEFDLSVVRTHKGDIERGVRGSLALANPDTGLEVEAYLFEAKEFKPNKVSLPLTLANPDPDGQPIQVFKDLVSDGKLRIIIRCLEFGQNFGAARPSLYLRAANAPFAMNFMKGYVGIWLQMVFVTCLGVMFSTFLNAPVAMVATVTAIVYGFFSEFVIDLARGQVVGGGPFEAFYRLITQKNLTSKLDSNSNLTEFILAADYVARLVLQTIGSLVPDFTQFSNVDYVAEGFNIPANQLAIQAMLGLGFVVPVFLAGFLFLKFREVAK